MRGDPVELKTYIPAKDFEVSKRFYTDLGFTLCWGGDGDLAYFHYGPHGGTYTAAFLLQRFYQKELAQNLRMHMLVRDVDAWWAHVRDNILDRYGLTADPPRDAPGSMRDFALNDPSGVLWFIAQDQSL